MVPSDFIRVGVVDKNYEPVLGNPLPYKTQIKNGVEFRYDSRLTDLKNKRYSFYIGSKVVSEYGGNIDRAVDGVTKRVINGEGLCSNGYKNLNKTMSDGVGGVIWNIACL